ncbi:MAG: lysylphosphatidylglycerol synthase domain-containing protein [Defluviimonas denitrificans]
MRDGPKVAAAAVVGDRMIDLAALACLMLTGFMLLPEAGEPGEQGMVVPVAMAVLALAAAALFAFPPVARLVWTRWPGLPARGLALRVAEAFGAGETAVLLLFTLVYSAAIQSVLIWLSIRLAEPVGVHVPVAAWFFAWPLAKIIATLPLSLGGLGVREGSLAALLVPFGAAAPDVVASGLAWQGILYLAGAIGALILVLSGGRLQSRATALKEISE